MDLLEPSTQSLKDEHRISSVPTNTSIQPRLRPLQEETQMLWIVKAAEDIREKTLPTPMATTMCSERSEL